MLREGGEKPATADLQILGPLGAGGFGAVYEALDTRSGRRVAVKELDDTSPDSIARFKHEFRALANCHHPNLVGLQELIEQNGRWLIVMELVPGTDFLRYVERRANDNAGPADVQYDEGRVRTALIGMAEGLRALHDFGLLHRDLKPSNVRVRPDGRAVLLDFGLATSVDPAKQSTHGFGVGTVVYMAPEQAGGQSLSPAVDLYALGVCLFEALTGRLPIEGDSAISILLQKQRICAPLASSIQPAVPTDLDALCARLLAIDPASRPSADEVLAVLRRSPLEAVSAPPRKGAPLHEDTFSGRDTELAFLKRALSRNDDGELRIVLVEGESGVGKSELISEFLRRTLETNQRLLVLRGRCYENEQVSYKAFDGCVDDLSRSLNRMPNADCQALLPEHAVLLGQLFPVLRKIKAIASAPREGISADPSARRLEAFAALSRLLAKIAEERPLVLVLDDLQWADVESFRLLAALAHQPVRAPILILGTVRPRDELATDVAAQLEEVRRWRHTDVVSLLGLTGPQARALAKVLLPSSTSEIWLDVIVEESQGHPLFMRELVQYAESRDFAVRKTMTLEAALHARIERLARNERELLELVALGTRPYPISLFASALSCNVDEAARTLLASKLLRQRRGQELGCYHDRIRHAAVDLIARARLPALHHQLAAALETVPGADASELGRHWDLAGDADRASRSYEQAAGNALGALAFSRAAGLCARAIALLGSTADERMQALSIQRANALASSGRSAEAATLFQQAADRAHGEARLRLRSDAATQLMLSAKITPGLDAAAQLLRDLGFKLPSNLRLGVLRYLWDLCCIAWHGRDDARERLKAPPRERLALELSQNMTTVVGCVQPFLTVLLTAQIVWRSARFKDLRHGAAVLAAHAWIRALAGSRGTVQALLAKAARADALGSDPYTVARTTLMVGTTYAASLDFASARPHLERAQQIAREQCPGDPWLLTSIRYQLAGTWYHLGQQAHCAVEVDSWIAEARERNDPLAVAMLLGMGYGFVRHLLRDEPALALEELARPAEAFSNEPYAFIQFGLLISSVLARLYTGGASALRYLDEHEAKHRGAFLLGTSTGRQARLLLRVLALLGAYGSADERERRIMLRPLEAAVRKLRRAPGAYGRAMGTLAHAQVEAIQGRREVALRFVRDARARFAALQHAGERSALYLEGLLEAGEGGAAKCEQASSRLREQGWRDPLRGFSITAPLLPLLVQHEQPSAPAAKARILDRYEVTGSLGRGGFGTVVAARDTLTGRTIALKELVRKGGISIEAFKREFRALAELHHENIVQLETLFEHAGTWYIAMELVAGSDLVSHVRQTGQCDAGRLRTAFAGLCSGLNALHAQGFVHRDVKPENVLVTAEGRSVVIDFGLVARSDQAAKPEPVGSLQSAAPEQLAGAVPDASADVYSVGACLYAALTGEAAGPLSFDESSLSAELAPFMRLCQLMLATDPGARPTLEACVELFTQRAQDQPAIQRSLLAPAIASESQSQFTGRERELQFLQQSFERAKQSTRLVLIQGESGLGKSALVQAFCAQVLSPDICLLQARCYEHEQVAFKAFDGATDQLAHYLRLLPPAQCQALLPKRAALLVQLFPALAAVPAIANAPRKGLPADPGARRQAARDCFAQLLVNLSVHTRLMLVIDDLQWADSDSFELLQILATRANALPLLVLCTVRGPAEIDGESHSHLQALQRMPATDLMTLEPLEPSAAGLLATRLLQSACPEPRLSYLVRESRGHPLFLRALLEHEKAGLSTTDETITLDAVLLARMHVLSDDARGLLSLVAIAEKPQAAHVYARALGRPELPREGLIAVLNSGLVERRGEKLACHHDRIRRVALSSLTPEAERGYARSLALALDADERADAAESARLWDLACDADKAAAAHELAGDRALACLGFPAAEKHYARALELLGPRAQTDQVARLASAQGHALVGAGRSAQAAIAFQRAATAATGEEQVRLRTRAAQHLLQSAQVEQGISLATDLLAELGVDLPRSDGVAKVRIAWERARARLKGIALREGAGAGQEALVLDALHGLSAPVRAVSFLRGSALVVQYLRRALAAGDPRHTARALAYEALLRTVNNPLQGQNALFERSRALAQTTSDAALLAEIDLTHGMACVSEMEVAQAQGHLARAQDLLQTQCPDQPWLLTSARMYLGSTWFMSGNFPDIARYGEAWVADARTRQDHYAFTALTGFAAASFRYLLREQPEEALAELAEARALWSPDTFATAHMGGLFGELRILSTLDDGPRFLDFLTKRERETRGAFLLRAAIPQQVLCVSRVQALLQSIEIPGTPAASQLLKQARACNRRLRRLKATGSEEVAAQFEGWFCLFEGDREGALRYMKLAQGHGPRTVQFYRLGARYTLGRLEGGEQGRAACDEVIAQISAEGWRDPRRGLALRTLGSLRLLDEL